VVSTRKVDEMALQRPLPGQYNGPREDPFSDVNWASLYPTLYSYLTERVYGDGKSRVTSTLLIFLEDGVLRICINDRDNNRSAFITGQTIDEALASIEAKLCGDTMEWRMKNQNASANARTPF